VYLEKNVTPGVSNRVSSEDPDQLKKKSAGTMGIEAKSAVMVRVTSFPMCREKGGKRKVHYQC